MLRKWKLACPKSPWNLVFPQADGGPQHRKAAWNIMKAATTKAGIKQPRFHDLRHIFASLLLLKGRPAIEVAGLMGHSSVE